MNDIMRDDYLSTCGSGVEEIDVADVKEGMTIDFLPDIQGGHLWVDVNEVEVQGLIVKLEGLECESYPSPSTIVRRFEIDTRVLEMFPTDPESGERVPLEVYAP